MATFFKRVKNAIKYWYLPLIVGVFFLVLGIYTLASPLESYAALSVLFAITFLVSGIMEIIFSISNRDEIENWGWSLTFGIVTLIIGILLIARPEVSMVTLPFYIGFIILFRSIAGVSFALDLKSYGVMDWGNLMVIAVLGIVFAFIMLWNPVFAGITIVVWTGIAIIMVGVFSIYLSIKLRKLHKLPKKISKELIEKWDDLQEKIKSEL